MRFGRVQTDLGMVTEVNVAEISALDYEGRGVAKVGGKTVFIKGALPSERVGFQITKQKKQFDEAETVAIFKVSDERTVPQCRYFERCGGCSSVSVRSNRSRYCRRFTDMYGIIGIGRGSVCH